MRTPRSERKRYLEPVILCEMLLTAEVTQEHEPAIRTLPRRGACSSVISTREDVTGNRYAPFLDEQEFVDHEADLQGNSEERASGHSCLERWSLLTRHGGQ